MLAELKFVQGAVAKKDFIPSLTHFEIKDGMIKGLNGSLALCAQSLLIWKLNLERYPLLKLFRAAKGRLCK